MTPKDFKLDIALSRARAQRMMAVSAIVHVLIVAWLVLFPPVTREHWDPVTEIAVINAEDLVAPEPEPEPVPAEPEEPAPAGPESIDPEPAPGPEPVAESAPAPEPAPAPRVAQREAAAPAAPRAPAAPPPAPRVETGARGRARAAEVAQ